MKVLRGFAMGWLAIIALLPAAALAKNTASQTITDIVAASGGEFDNRGLDFDILLNAVLAADLAGALADPDADLTVFAPNDKAFIRLARDLGYTGYDEAGAFDAIVMALTQIGDGDPIPVLTDVLLYHVSPGSKTRREIRAGGPIETLLEGASIVSWKRLLIDADPDFRNPVLFRPANIKASNGIIQPINRVLIPVDLDNGFPDVGTITSLVAASGGTFDYNWRDFDILLNAVLAAGLDGALADETAALTVFAPDDRAFFRLARLLGYEGTYDEEAVFLAIVDALTVLGEGDPIPLLTNVLLYHVAPGALSLNTVLLSEEIETLLEGGVLVPKGFGLEDADRGVRNPHLILMRGDLRADNGLIHPINRVLLPLQISTPKSNGKPVKK